MPRGLAAVRGQVFILYHPTRPSLERAAREAQAYERLREHFPAMNLLIWVGEPFPPPEQEVRKVYAQAFRAGPPLNAVAWIVDTHIGMSGSVFTSISTQMFAPGTAVKVYREPFEAASWLAGVESSKADVDEILDGLDALDRA